MLVLIVSSVVNVLNMLSIEVLAPDRLGRPPLVLGPPGPIALLV